MLPQIKTLCSRKMQCSNKSNALGNFLAPAYGPVSQARCPSRYR